MTGLPTESGEEPSFRQPERRKDQRVFVGLVEFGGHGVRQTEMNGLIDLDIDHVH
jgi:hypothetical protein